MKFFVFAGLFFLPCFVSAAPPVYEMPITSRGDVQTVSVSTFAWTASSELTNGDLAGNTGVFVVNYSTNPASIGIVCDTAAPSEALSERMAELQPGEWDVFPCSEKFILYLVAYHTAAFNIQTQEVANYGN